jgi:four helix bundle protein
MFDFEKLDVYNRIKEVNKEVLKIIFSGVITDLFLKDQWKRATLSVQLNLAEGTGRLSGKDKRHYYTIARGSVYECVALIDILTDNNMISNETYQRIYASYETISKMLLGMYRNTPDTASV